MRNLLIILVLFFLFFNVTAQKIKTGIVACLFFKATNKQSNSIAYSNDAATNLCNLFKYNWSCCLKL